MEKNKEKFFVSGKHIASFVLLMHSITGILFLLIYFLFSPIYGIGIFYNTFEMIGLVPAIVIIFGGAYKCSSYPKSVSSMDAMRLYDLDGGNVRTLVFNPQVAVIILILIAVGLIGLTFISFKKRLKVVSILSGVGVLVSLVLFIAAMIILNFRFGPNQNQPSGYFTPNRAIITSAIIVYIEQTVIAIVGIIMIPIKDATPKDMIENRQKNKQREYKNDYPFLG